MEHPILTHPLQIVQQRFYEANSASGVVPAPGDWGVPAHFSSVLAQADLFDSVS
jgi:hypothetical protein